MKTVQPDQAGKLGFLQPYLAESEIFSLPSGANVPIPKYFLEFKEWKGAPIPNTYNGKAVIDWHGEPVFAELAVLRLFQSHGWSGVWVDSYRRKYRVGLPDVVDPVELPETQKRVVEREDRKERWVLGHTRMEGRYRSVHRVETVEERPRANIPNAVAGSVSRLQP